MAADTYNNFDDLKKKEKRGKDYNICVVDIGSPVTIIAPHGGKIEPKTSYIAERIAGGKFNFYCFEGIKAKNNFGLHITSHKFDEPQARRLLKRSTIVVAIHACTDTEAVIYPGGRDVKLIGAIAEELSAAGIVVAERNSRYKGVNPKNICNCGLSGKGVQLEISRGLRDDMDQVDLLCDAVHTALTGFKAEAG